jgi:hypothetical protein
VSEPPNTFITVEFGAKEERIFNPWCSGHTLTEWIRKQCHCDSGVALDLIDNEEGQLTNLPEHQQDYANEFITGRKKYVLLQVERMAEGGTYFKYTSLLNNLDDLYPELASKLEELSKKPQTPKTRRGNVAARKASLKPPKK